jgi:hypothetical protein
MLGNQNIEVNITNEKTHAQINKVFTGCAQINHII